MLFSDRRAASWTWLGAAALIIAGLFFHLAQNSGALPGGAVAPVKVLWLGYVLFFWFWLPAVLLAREPLNSQERFLFGLHMVNVLARGGIELIMMYGFGNWHPFYGIAHDLISAIVLAVILAGRWKYVRPPFTLLGVTLAVMFVVEASFAAYMQLVVVEKSGPVYFVPNAPEYAIVLAITWIAIALLSIELVYFMRRVRHART